MNKRGKLTYIREVLKSYPDIQKKVPETRTENEKRRLEAVELAMEELGKMPDGERRKKFVRLRYFENQYTFWGAVKNTPTSRRTAERWNASLMDIMEEKLHLI